MAEITDEPLRTILRPRLPVDLELTLGILTCGRAHPCLRSNHDGCWSRATRTPIGPATARLAWADGGICVEAWGPGKEWVLDAAPEFLGARDRVDGFDPPLGNVRDLHRWMPGLRIPRSQAVFETLVPTVLEQKVPGVEAFATYRNLVRAIGEPWWPWATPMRSRSAITTSPTWWPGRSSAGHGDRRADA